MVNIADITSWNSCGMDWEHPDPFKIEYYIAIGLALHERLLVIDINYQDPNRFSVELNSFINYYNNNQPRNSALYDTPYNILDYYANTILDVWHYYIDINTTPQDYNIFNSDFQSYLDNGFYSLKPVSGSGYSAESTPVEVVNPNKLKYFRGHLSIADFPASLDHPEDELFMQNNENYNLYKTDAEYISRRLKSLYNIINKMRYCRSCYNYITTQHYYRIHGVLRDR